MKIRSPPGDFHKLPLVQRYIFAYDVRKYGAETWRPSPIYGTHIFFMLESKLIHSPLFIFSFPLALITPYSLT